MKVIVKDKYMSKFNDSEYEVYDIKNDSNGYPCFLILEENQWRYFSAKFFIPKQNNDTLPYIVPSHPPFGIYTTGDISYSDHTEQKQE